MGLGPGFVYTHLFQNNNVYKLIEVMYLILIFFHYCQSWLYAPPSFKESSALWNFSRILCKNSCDVGTYEYKQVTKQL